MSDLQTLVTAWSQLSGVAQFHLLVWASVAMLAAHAGLAQLNAPAWAKALALVLSVPLCLWVAWWLRGTFGDLGLLSVVAVVLAAWRAVVRPAASLSLGLSGRDERSSLALLSAIIVAMLGWGLYANLLGLGSVDVLAWGEVDHAPTRQALITGVGQANLWTLLLDPFLVLAATAAALRGGAAALRRGA